VQRNKTRSRESENPQYLPQYHRSANVLCNAVRRLYQSSLYLQNVIWFHGKRVHVISFTPIREVLLSTCQRCNTQQQDTLASFKVDKKKVQSREKNSIIPLHKICISVHKSTQSSMFYNNKEDHSLSTHHWHNSNLYYSIRVLFWGFMQQRMVVLHRHFRTTYQCHLQGSNSTRLLDPLGLDPYVVPEHQYEITVLCCIKSQKSADLNDAGVEAFNHAHSCIPHYQQTDNIIEHQHAWEVQAASTLQVGEYPPRRS